MAENGKTNGNAEVLARKDFTQKVIENVEPKIKAALPKGMKPEHFLRVLASAIQKNPELLKCNPASVILSAIQAAELGLEPNGILGYAYLVPYKGTAQLQIGYRGFIELARRSNAITHIVAEVVYANDHFVRKLGTDRSLVHEPLTADRGEAIGAYAVVFYRNGTNDFEYMTEKEILRAKAVSRSANSEYSPWQNWPDEMRRKTAIRRLMKRVPLSPEDRMIQEAAAMDEENDLEPIRAGYIEKDSEAAQETLPVPGNVPSPYAYTGEETQSTFELEREPGA